MTTLTATTAADGEAQAPGTGQRRRGVKFWRAVRHNRKATAGALLLLFFLVLAVFPGQIAPYSGTAEIFQPGLGPSGAHWFGTTAYGQDVLSQLIWGTRQSLIIAFAVGALATCIAVMIGVSAAYLRGAWDGVLSLITDVLLVIPVFPLIIVIAAYLKSAGTLMMIIVLGALGWSYGARQLRAQALSLRDRDFLEAARVRGERRGYTIVVEVLPTMTSLIVASFLGTAVYAVLTAAGLQFVGLGNPNMQSWGTMLYWAENNEALGAGMPLWALTPGVCVALLGAALALLNYAFDEISNPALRPVRARAKRAQRLAPTSQSPNDGGDDQEVRSETGTALPPRGTPGQDAPPGRPLLSVRQLSVGYATGSGFVRAVDGVDLDLAPGEFLAIVGESGCGKSTLLFALARLLNPPATITGGTIDFKGHNMVDITEKRLRYVRWQEYSVVMQSAMNALNPVMTVAQQMTDVCRAHTEMTSAEIEQRSREALRLVSIDPVHLNSYPHQLSGGMRQRAMIAMALLFTPDLVIMDEPTSALDVVAQRSLMAQVKELQKRLGFAVIFVTHDMSLVSHFADRLMVMYAGQVAEIGPTGDIFSDPLHPYARGLIEAFPSIRGPKVLLSGIPGYPPDLVNPPTGCRFHPRCPWAVPECALEEPAVYVRGSTAVRCSLYKDEGNQGLPDKGDLDKPTSSAMAQALAPFTEANASRPATADGTGEPLVQTSALTRHFRIGGLVRGRTLHAVEDLELVIGRKEIVALVGESGSGKSTVARLLAKVYPPTTGQILFEGARVAQLKGRASALAYRNQVPMVFQDPFSSMNPVFHVSHGLLRAMKLHRRDLDKAARQAEAVRVMEAVGLVPAQAMLEKYPYEMSGGQRQRVGFAQALALRPKLIVADEPVSMLDVSIRVGLLNLMVKLREEEGVSFLYITHDIASARYVADRVLVMYAGRIVEQGPTEQVLADPRHPYTKLLLRAAPDPRAPLDLSEAADAGEPPKVVDPKPGCAFAPRCPVAVEQCHRITPVLGEVAPLQLAACHVAQRESASLVRKTAPAERAQQPPPGSPASITSGESGGSTPPPAALK
jgi:oligopeptide/dipeptide ABC transporter ATP-binding protein